MDYLSSPGYGGRHLGQMLPYNLDSGLMLEDADLILRWNDSGDQLSESSDFWQRIDGHLVISWRNHTILGGLRGNATTVLRDSPDATPTGFKLGLSNGDRADSTLAAAYDALHPELVARFGKPTEQNKADCNSDAVWTLGEVNLRHEFWDGFGGDHFVLIYPATQTYQTNT